MTPLQLTAIFVLLAFAISLAIQLFSTLAAWIINHYRQIATTDSPSEPVIVEKPHGTSSEGGNCWQVGVLPMAKLEKAFQKTPPGPGPSPLPIVDDSERISLMINEEDHIRMQALGAGLLLSDVWEELSSIDDELDGHLDFAFERPWGYLTACPSNAGTGLRASVLIHLPGLIMTKRIVNILQTAAKMSLAIRGLHGEGSEMLGDYFQISNQATMGKPEEEIVAATEKLTRDLIEQERSARDDLMKSEKIIVDDRIGRAVAIISSAKVLTVREAMELLSSIRLGIHYGLVPGISSDALDALLIRIQPAHLQKRFPKHLDPLERDIERAKLLREALKYGEG